MKNKAAQELGRMAAGKPKNYSEAELERRRKRMKAMNAKRRTRPSSKSRKEK